MMHRSSCVLFLACAAHSAAAEQTLVSRGAPDARQPQAAVDEQGQVHVVFGSGDSLYYCRSSDGQDFTEPLELPTGGKLALGMRRGPRCRDGTLTYRGMQRLLVPTRREVKALLLRGVFSTNARLIGMCEELYQQRVWLQTFLEVEGAKPTNKAAERALRPAVIWRKLLFGTQSAAGSRFVETLLKVVATCRQQDRPALDDPPSSPPTSTAGPHRPCCPGRARLSVICRGESQPTVRPLRRRPSAG